MFEICLIISLIFAIMVVLSMYLQKDIFIKLLFLNTGTNLAALFICFLGSYKVNTSYIDIALIYFLLSSIASSAWLKYFLQKNQNDQEQRNEKSP